MTKDVQTDHGIVEADRARLYYEAFGRGRPVVILHGGPGFDHNHMLPIAELADQYRIIFYDQRGTGNSTCAVGPATITLDNFLADLEAVRQALHLDRMHLIGHSWGACLAMHYAVSHPERLASLTLLSTGGASFEYFSSYAAIMWERTPPHDRLAMRKIQSSPAFRRREIPALQQYYRISIKPLFHRPEMIKDLDLSLTANTAANQARVAHLLLRDLGRFDLHDRLSRIHCPTLLIHGDKDIFAPQVALRVRRAIPDCRMVLLPDAGHFLFIESRRPTFQLLRSFLADPASVSDSLPDDLAVH